MKGVWSNSELPRMLSGIVDDSLTPAEFEELEAILLNDPVAREEYHKFLRVHALLSWRWSKKADLRVGQEVVSRDAGRDANSSSGLPTSKSIRNPEILIPPAPVDTIPATVLSSSPSLGWSSIAYRGISGVLSQEVPFACFIAAVVLGIGLLIGANIYVSHPEPQQVARNVPDRPSPVNHEPMPELVGRITGMIDCRWSADGRPPYSYDNVPVGRQYKLDSGLMEITYDSGAKVILQGPCTYEVNSPAGGFLSLGKLTARVEGSGVGGRGSGSSAKPQAADIHHSAFSTHHSPNSQSPNPGIPKSPNPLFTVTIPTAVITDLGTEFGVNVQANHTAEVCVFDGMIEVARTTSENRRAEVIRLAANEALRVEPAGPVRSMTTDELAAGYVRRLPRIHSPSGLQNGLVAYWSFDDSENPGKNSIGNDHLDSIGGATCEPTGLLGGALKLHSDAASDTLLFKGGHGVPKGIPTGNNSYSISAWYLIDAMPHKGNFDIIGWGEPTLGRANALFVYGESADQCMVRNYWWDNDICGFVDSASATGAWHHAAVTYNHRGRMQYLYLDGVRIGLRAVEQRPDFAAGNFSIGRRYMAAEYAPLRIAGLLDEIGIWNRELMESEVLQLFNQGKGRNPLLNGTSTHPITHPAEGGASTSTSD